MVCLISNNFRDSKWFKSIIIKLLVRYWIFDVFRYQSDFVTRDQLLGNMIMIIKMCLSTLSLNHFWDQNFKNNLVYTQTFIFFKDNVN